jgi:TolB protein
MLSKFRLFRNILVILTVVLLSSCKEDIVQPELYGSISGIVMDQSTSAVIEGAGITTSPPTSAILTASNGKFTIDNIPVGNYTITAQKNV